MAKGIGYTPMQIAFFLTAVAKWSSQPVALQMWGAKLVALLATELTRQFCLVQVTSK